MTKKELYAILDKHPDDTKILVKNYNEGYKDATQAGIESAVEDYFDGVGGFGPWADETEINDVEEVECKYVFVIQ